MDGATAEVYKFMTQQFNECLLILYVNIGDKPVTLTIGVVKAKANMYSLGTEVKTKINSVTKQVKPDRAKELWSKLKFEQNKLVSSDSMLRTELFPLINKYHLINVINLG